MREENQWHLDKRIPIAIIVGMLGQVAFFAWGAAVMFKDIETNRVGIRNLSERVTSTEAAASQQAIQLGRIEENIRGMRGDLNRLLNILDSRLE